MQEKHGLWLFCAFILIWTLTKPSHHNAEPEDIPRAAARPRYAPVAPIPADPGIVPRASDNGAAPGGPPAIMAETASANARGAAAYGGPASSSDGSAAGGPGTRPTPSASLGAGAQWQMGAASGGAGATAGPLTPAQRTAAAAAAAAAEAAGAGSRGSSASAGSAFSGSAPGVGSGPGARRGGAPGASGGLTTAQGRGAAGDSALSEAAQTATGATAAQRAQAAGGGGGGRGGGGGSRDPGGASSGAPELSGAGAPSAAPAGSAKSDIDAAKAAGVGGTGGDGAAGTGAAAAPSAPTAAGPSGGTGGPASGPINAADDPAAAQDAANVPPLVGSPQIPNAEKTNDLYANKHGGPRVIPILEVKDDAKKTIAVTFTGKMSIDADGRGGAAATDRTGKSETSLQIKGQSLNPQVTPYVVKPTDFGHGVQLGDYAAVTYNKKTVITIVGDNGPQDEVGECSMACAAKLDINHDPNSGGVGGGVTYTFLPGSRDSPPPLNAADIKARGMAKFAGVGIKFQ